MLGRGLVDNLPDRGAAGVENVVEFLLQNHAGLHGASAGHFEAVLWEEKKQKSIYAPITVAWLLDWLVYSTLSIYFGKSCSTSLSTFSATSDGFKRTQFPSEIQLNLNTIHYREKKTEQEQSWIPAAMAPTNGESSKLIG